MKEWYSPAEIVTQLHPEMDGKEREAKIRLWQTRAKNGEWRNRRNLADEPLALRAGGKGGGWRYHYTLFPHTVQAKLVRDGRSEFAVPARQAVKKHLEKSEIWSWFDRQSETKKARAEKKLRAIQAVKALQKGGLQLDVAVNQVAREIGKGPRTLYNWFGEVAGVNECDWLPHLCPRHTGRTTTVECSPEAWEFLKRYWLCPSQPQFTDAYIQLELIAPEKGWTIPSARTLERRLSMEIPKPIRVYFREGVEALKRMYPPQDRDRTQYHALEAVNVDGHKWDVFVKWPGRDKPVRPLMVAIQDLYSNKILAWRIDFSENTDCVRLAFKDLFETWGIPDHCFLDNGRAFASKYISGQTPNRYRFKVKPEEPTGILTALGIELHWTTPYSGQSKPIERAFRDLCNAVARHPLFEGAYTGNKPEAKPENYGSRAVDLDLFLRVVEQGIRLYNARAGRRTRVCGGVQSFDQVFERSYAEAPIKKATPEQLRMCLLAAESVRTDRNSGSITLLGNRYWHDCLHSVIGQAVTVRFDPDRLHDDVHVYRLDGTYVGAAECRDPVGFSDMEAGRQHARQRSAWNRKQKELAAIERGLSLDDLAALLPDIEEPSAPETKVVRMVKGNTVVEREAEADSEDRPETDFHATLTAGLALINGGLGDD